ncbi:hypothetical protein N7G274_008416 [Stereocaulon virgatum]|uniref:Catalase core domain-containing protein n=1 Tax=Stereocaulon virgatum TaxID=373712 RepID=A0ABR3ZYY2_9LECA
MPFSSDPQIAKTSQDLVSQFHTIFGPQPGIRPAHGKGLLLAGTFHPSKAAATLTTAPHLITPTTTPLTIRFSNSTGLPNIPDTDPNANPRGIGIRFHIAEHIHTDVIAHSTPYFPTRTGAEFLEFLKALSAHPPENGGVSAVEEFLASHPAALAFVRAEKAAPSSFAREAFYGVNAFRFVDGEGRETVFRYRIVPTLGEEHLDEEGLKARSPDFLFEDMMKRVEGGEETVFKLLAQIAEEGDVVDDATVRWPESRKLVELGEVRVEKVVGENAKKQKKIIYDPIPRVEGIEASADPLLEMRANVYLISGKERRAA